MDRILLVDSDVTACSAISRTLSGLGYGIDVAYDADDARRLAASGNYRIGLFGERLSDGDGVQLFRELQLSQNRMRGVLVAAAANLYTVVKAIGCGMTRIVSKPIDFRDLVAFIETEGAMATTLKEPAAQATAARSPVLREEDIAELTTQDIEFRLSEGELIDVIRSVDYPFAGKDRLEFFDRDTLQRVVHLIRRWCRNRLQRSAWSG